MAASIQPAGVPVEIATRIPISVVIAARNEAANIVGCIDSLGWADEVLVADHGSTDETPRLAQRAGAIVLVDADAATIGALRNAAIAGARNEWVLVVDADECGTPQLAGTIVATIAAPRHEAYRIRRRNFFMGGEIRHGGWERDRPVRLFRRSLRYDDSLVHEHVVTSGAVGDLDAALLHYPYASMKQYFEKFARYSEWWAVDQARRGRRASAAAVVLKPPARFVSMYLFRLGLLDGRRGAVLAALAAASVMAKYARLWALTCES
ncbi:MAG: glycosyltransferase family 2 protein [Gemmatimonadaceae bacterium]